MSQDRTPRAKLSPEYRKGGWYARGFVPVRQGDGSIARRRIERSAGAGCTSKAQCQKFCDDLNRMFEERAMATRRPRTFAKAMQNYIETGKPVPQFAEQILKYFGTTLCNEIDNDALLDAAKAILPPGATPAYTNRHVYTPVIAVLNMASRDKVCERPNFVRPKGYTAVKKVDAPADDSWYRTLVEYLPTHTAALMTALTVHGARVGELVRCLPDDLNPVTGQLYLGKTKNGDIVMITLEPSVLEITLRILPEVQATPKGLKLYGYTTTDGFNKTVREACARAGLPYYSSHKLGRHRFAHRMLDEGYSLQHVKDAGRWQTLEVLSDRYGHRAHTEHTETVHRVGASLARALAAGGEVGEEVAASSPVSSANPVKSRG